MSVFSNDGKNTLNTHIKTIRVWFQKPIPYLSAWNYLLYADDDERGNYGGVDWNTSKALLYKDGIIKDLGPV